jgi:hypothetical protein
MINMAGISLIATPLARSQSRSRVSHKSHIDEGEAMHRYSASDDWEKVIKGVSTVRVS